VNKKNNWDETARVFIHVQRSGSKLACANRKEEGHALVTLTIRLPSPHFSSYLSFSSLF
jgi:hypothetical protein